jgi:hypothetical protein
MKSRTNQCMYSGTREGKKHGPRNRTMSTARDQRGLLGAGRRACSHAMVRRCVPGRPTSTTPKKKTTPTVQVHAWGAKDDEPDGQSHPGCAGVDTGAKFELRRQEAALAVANAVQGARAICSKTPVGATGGSPSESVKKKPAVPWSERTDRWYVGCLGSGTHVSPLLP